MRHINASVIEPSIVNDAMRLGDVRNPEARPLVVGSAECSLEAFLSGEIELFA